MSNYTEIDLSKLPPPTIIEQYSFEEIFNRMKDTLNSIFPMTFNENSSFPVVVDAEKIVDVDGSEFFKIPCVVDDLLYVNIDSDPCSKVLSVCAYRECLLRQRLNESLKAVMLAYASGSDLDQHGANYGVQRLILHHGDPDKTPPEPTIYESDSDFRRRILLVFESLSVAGSAGSYVYHALKSNPNVLDVNVDSPQAGDVVITVMSRIGSGAADDELIQSVVDYLRNGDIRPLTDNIIVNSAIVKNYQIDAKLVLYDGVGADVVLLRAKEKLKLYVDGLHRLGLSVVKSGIYASLHVDGVKNVLLKSPVDDLEASNTDVFYCTDMKVVVNE